MAKGFLLLCIAVQLLAPLSSYADQPHNTRRAESFTGKLTKDRVRMRLQPSLDSYVFKELNRDDFVLVTAEVDEFYAVMPPKELKGYIFRTYILDGVVEGSKVNVRLEPDVTSPVVTQLNTGDKVNGQPAPQNNKWLQISLPEDVRFYVAKDFVVQEGDATLYTEHEEHQKTLQARLTTLDSTVKTELKKPFSKIELAPIAKELQEIIQKNNDYPQEKEQAEALLLTIQKEYLSKSIETEKPQPIIATSAPTQTESVQTKSVQVQPAQTEPAKPAITTATNPNSTWKEKEDALITASGLANKEAFYAQERSNATTISGIIKPYNSFVKNRPGDFILINPKTNLPHAYLYSTLVDLEHYVNKDVKLKLAPRPNNCFAFDAYFVLNIDE